MAKSFPSPQKPHDNIVLSETGSTFYAPMFEAMFWMAVHNDLLMADLAGCDSYTIVNKQKYSGFYEALRSELED